MLTTRATNQSREGPVTNRVLPEPLHRAHQDYPMITSHEQQYPIVTTQDYPRAMRTYSSAHTSSMDSGALHDKQYTMIMISLCTVCD